MKLRTIGLLFLFLTPVMAQVEGDGVSTSKVDAAANAYQQMELLTEVLFQIKENYVEERTYEELIHGALAGLLSSLDPHSSFMEADEYEDLIDDTSGKYGGVGIHIGLRDGVLTVIAPIEDTPGFRAGLQSGDKIVAIDGESTMSMSLRDAVNKMRGEKGAKIVLGILGEGDAEPKPVEIIRDEINVLSVKGVRFLQGGIGYIRLVQFSEPTADMLAKEIARLKGEGMKALVLDLRGNPGGLLEQSVRVASLFFEPGTLVVTTRGRGEAGKVVEYRAEGEAYDARMPLVVLVNEGSASASEIVAGVIQDHRRGILIGQTTFGKGSVQSVIGSRTDEASAIRLTTAYYYTPAERKIHQVGVKPDIVVELSRDEWLHVQMKRAHQEVPDAFSAEELAEFADAVDHPLQRAVDLLQALLILDPQGSK